MPLFFLRLCDGLANFHMLSLFFYCYIFYINIMVTHVFKSYVNIMFAPEDVKITLQQYLFSLLESTV